MTHDRDDIISSLVVAAGHKLSCYSSNVLLDEKAVFAQFKACTSPSSITQRRPSYLDYMNPCDYEQQ